MAKNKQQSPNLKMPEESYLNLFGSQLPSINYTLYLSIRVIITHSLESLIAIVACDKVTQSVDG